eukprot:scaffold104685_cov33-Tisochrysis_lutea.AAC.5
MLSPRYSLADLVLTVAEGDRANWADFQVWPLVMGTCLPVAVVVLGGDTVAVVVVAGSPNGGGRVERGEWRDGAAVPSTFS